MTTDIVDRILNLYVKYGSSDYIGENITQTEHALQCADCASHDLRLDSYDDYIKNCMIVAALLHDIGHLIGLENGDIEMRIGSSNICSSNIGNSLGIVGHEGIGRDFLRQCGMPLLVYELVGAHVQTKRYLCSTKKDYYNKLSDASKQTMALQGGIMSLEEIKQFNSSIHPELKVYLREYDDIGKQIIDSSNNTISNGITKYKKNIEISLMHAKFFV